MVIQGGDGSEPAVEDGGHFDRVLDELGRLAGGIDTFNQQMAVVVAEMDEVERAPDAFD